MIIPIRFSLFQTKNNLLFFLIQHKLVKIVSLYYIEWPQKCLLIIQFSKVKFSHPTKNIFCDTWFCLYLYTSLSEEKNYYIPRCLNRIKYHDMNNLFVQPSLYHSVPNIFGYSIWCIWKTWIYNKYKWCVSAHILSIWTDFCHIKHTFIFMFNLLVNPCNIFSFLIHFQVPYTTNIYIITSGKGPFFIYDIETNYLRDFLYKMFLHHRVIIFYIILLFLSYVGMCRMMIIINKYKTSQPQEIGQNSLLLNSLFIFYISYNLFILLMYILLYSS